MNEYSYKDFDVEIKQRILTDKSILEKYYVLGNYFEKTRSKIEAQSAAHILEHYVSGEVINNIKKLSILKMEGVPLMKLEFKSRLDHRYHVFRL